MADMPYTLDDTGSPIPLGITIDVTPGNDGWIINSETCGYSFIHPWEGVEPKVTLRLDGDRYDNDIVGTCAEIPF
jgi:hypothetical protein